MGADNFLGDRESQTSSMNLGGKKRIENAGSNLRTDSRSIVLPPTSECAYSRASPKELAYR
jgi:hypothetical protein